jgi:uncharacterized protein YacL (UPF0231 family)
MQTWQRPSNLKALTWLQLLKHQLGSTRVRLTCHTLDAAACWLQLAVQETLPRLSHLLQELSHQQPTHCCL